MESEESLRRRAEDFLEGRLESIKDMSPKDMQRLVHELQVHQIELEMQNEELRRAQQELGDSQKKYRRLYDRAPVGYFTLDEKGMVLDANPAGANLLGVSRALFFRNGKPFSSFVARDQLDLFYEHLRVAASREHSCELRLKNHNGTSFYAQLTSIPEGEGEGNRILTVVSDVSALKRVQSSLEEANRMLEYRVRRRTESLEEANLALRRSEERYRALFYNNPIDTVVVDREGKVAGYNHAKKASEARLPAIGCTMYRDYASGHKLDMHAELMDCIQNGILKDFPEQKYRDKYLHVKMSPFPEGAIITTVDVTERKLSEEAISRSRSELKVLSSRLLSAQEEERRRIARELHDGICQSLAYYKIAVSNALREGGPNSSAYAMLKDIPSQIAGDIGEVRRLISDLRPSMLENLGVLAAISNLCEGLKEKKKELKLQVNQTVDIDEREIPAHLKIVLFRTLQEALNNVIKHSGADRVDVSLVKKDGWIEMGVKDNGCGFDPEEAASRSGASGGVGLGSMKERVELSGGKLKLTSDHGKGTLVEAFWATDESVP